MFFRQRAAEPASLSYLFGCGSEGLAVAVDVVAGDEDWFVDEACRAGSRITHVFDTHLHADRRSGGRELARRAGADYCLHADAAASARFGFTPLEDGQRVIVGNVEVRVLHTPGHTPESVCLLVTDRRRGEAPWFVLTGDTLFVGALGRPDLAGRESEMAGQLYDSLHGKLLTLLDTVEIFPAHQAGSACGGGISGKPSSTVGFERRHNPALGLHDRAAFVALVTRDLPPPPAGKDAILAANLGA